MWLKAVRPPGSWYVDAVAAGSKAKWRVLWDLNWLSLLKIRPIWGWYLEFPFLLSTVWKKLRTQCVDVSFVDCVSTMKVRNDFSSCLHILYFWHDCTFFPFSFSSPDISFCSCSEVTTRPACILFAPFSLSSHRSHTKTWTSSCQESNQVVLKPASRLFTWYSKFRLVRLNGDVMRFSGEQKKHFSWGRNNRTSPLWVAAGLPCLRTQFPLRDIVAVWTPYLSVMESRIFNLFNSQISKSYDWPKLILTSMVTFWWDEKARTTAVFCSKRWTITMFSFILCKLLCRELPLIT